MENSSAEMAVVEAAVVNAVAKDVRELGDLQLALLGGGQVEVSLI